MSQQELLDLNIKRGDLVAVNGTTYVVERSNSFVLTTMQFGRPPHYSRAASFDLRHTTPDSVTHREVTPDNFYGV